jgi:hypothetical protein
MPFLAVFCGQQNTNNDVAGRVIQVPLFYGRTAADFRLWSGLLRQLARGVPGLTNDEGRRSQTLEQQVLRTARPV